MVRAFLQLALTVQAFLDAHRFGTFLDLLYQIFHLFQPACRISGYSLMELSQAELHIMEIRDGLAQRTLGYIGQHGLEITERFASLIRKLTIKRDFVGFRRKE